MEKPKKNKKKTWTKTETLIFEIGSCFKISQVKCENKKSKSKLKYFLYSWLPITNYHKNMII